MSAIAPNIDTSILEDILEDDQSDSAESGHSRRFGQLVDVASPVFVPVIKEEGVHVVRGILWDERQAWRNCRLSLDTSTSMLVMTVQLGPSHSTDGDLLLGLQRQAILSRLDLDMEDRMLTAQVASVCDEASDAESVIGLMLKTY